MTHALIPDFSVPLGLPMPRFDDALPWHADPILAAIEAHEEAFAVYQVALPGEAAARADDDLAAALDALLATPCATRAGAFCLLRHLRWWLGDQVGLAEQYQPAFGMAQAREADLTLLLGADDRIALINYATWLHYERRLVCAELYPEAGSNAHRLVHSDVAADHFHFPRGRRWQDVPKPSTRAVATLDRLGIDWRADRTGSGWADEPLSSDPDAKLPHGWPKADAALLEALDDLTRIDAAISTMHDAGSADRDADTVPGYDGLEEARNDTLNRLATERAESLLGMQAKAKALLTRCLSDQGGEEYQAVAASLARDLLGARPNKIEPRPDPILALIEEARRLCAEHTAACNPDKPAHLPDPPEVVDRRDDAYEALAAFIDGTLLKTVPTTGEGCKALARFAVDFNADQGVPLQGAADSNDAVLALIARSPLL